MAILCDKHSMLVLGAQAAIPCHDRPPIAPALMPGVAVDEYRLDGEGLIGHHHRPLPVFDRGDYRVSVEMLTHAMPNKIRTDRDLDPVCQVVDRLYNASHLNYP